MELKFIEATNGQQNWGKFVVMRFDMEFAFRSAVDKESPRSLLGQRGWGPEHIIVFDLETGEGAEFLPGGSAHADLDKHKIWVCPLFEPFLVWLYKQDLKQLSKLPNHVDLPDAPFALSGYRREGVGETALKGKPKDETPNRMCSGVASGSGDSGVGLAATQQEGKAGG